MRVISAIPEGLIEEGAKELIRFGAYSVKGFRRSISFEADLSCIYRLHLRARLPYRFLIEVTKFSCNSSKELYEGIRNFFISNNWLPVPSNTFRVDVTGACSGLNHSHFTALQVKNALVDLQRERWGKRSDINLLDPDICFHLYLSSSGAVLSLNAYPRSLHRREYKPAMGLAPLKANLAAGLILLSGWKENLPLVDPLCGSGTFLIEAVSLALDLPPGLNKSFLFHNWPNFNMDLWKNEKQEATLNQRIGVPIKKIIGCEKDIVIANQARQNVNLAGLKDYIEIKSIDFQELSMPKGKGIIVCNPPYGIRVGKSEDLSSLYKDIGSFFKEKASGWKLWMLSGDRTLTRFLKMKSSIKIPISNGGIDCRWIQYLIN